MSAGTRLTIATVAAVVLTTSYASARRRPIPEAELAATRWFNQAPDVVAWMLWPVMQAGQFFAPAVVALAVGFGWRRWPLSAAIAATGWTAWLVAKLIKDQVERQRPVQFLPDVVVREGSGGSVSSPATPPWLPGWPSSSSQ